MTVYIDNDYKCHVADEGGMIAVENEFFDGKCKTFIEGYCFVPAGNEYNGIIIVGDMYFPWIDISVLEAAQIAYEREEYKRLLAENANMKGALAELGVTEDD